MSGRHRGTLQTLAIDIGGTGIKATVLDEKGRMLVERQRVATPYPCSPEILVQTVFDLIAAPPRFDRVSVGFPEVIRDGHVLTAPHFGNDIWRGCPLTKLLAEVLKKPVRLLNDAEVQGLGIMTGKGLEVVLTLGTGVGTAIFRDGRLMPHLELAHHPIRGRKTYNDYVGEAALRDHGVAKWNRRVLKMIAIVESLINYDQLYLGGGNSAHIEEALPARVALASNDAGLTGGIRLWDRERDELFKGSAPRRGRTARAVPPSLRHPAFPPI